MHLHVLVVDNDDILDKSEYITYYNLKFITSITGLKLITKYKNQSDKLRWALKSVFMQHLLMQTDKIIYVDNDIYFYNDPKMLFDLLDTNDILLTPHFYDSNPNLNQNWLEANFKVGLYNAGFIGVNTNATKALQWWSECCLYNIKKSYWRGLFDDQKYLDLLPVLFEGVMVLKHKGCNLAGWNYLWYKLDRKKDSEVEIEKTYQLLFIHFAETSLIHFSKKRVSSTHRPLRYSLKSSLPLFYPRQKFRTDFAHTQPYWLGQRNEYHLRKNNCKHAQGDCIENALKAPYRRARKVLLHCWVK